MERRALGRDPELSRRMAWTMLALVVIYGGVLAYLTVFAVLWTRQGAPTLAAAAFVPLWLVLGALGPYRTALRLVGAHVASPTEKPELHAALDRLCALADAPRPRLAVSEDEVPAAFAVGVRPSRSAIVLTRGLLRRLEPGEVEAVLAHELTHVLNRDGAVMTAASFPLFAAAWLVDAARRKPATWLLLVFVLPYALVGAALYFVCGALTRSLAMNRELAADRGGAILTGAPERLASALQKLTGALPLIPKEDLRRIAPLNALLIVGIDPVLRAHPPMQERLAQLAAIGREEGRADPPKPGPRLGIAVAVFLAVFAGTLFVFLRV
jgi:heat shock protein HtpX